LRLDVGHPSWLKLPASTLPILSPILCRPTLGAMEPRQGWDGLIGCEWSERELREELEDEVEFAEIAGVLHCVQDDELWESNADPSTSHLRRYAQDDELWESNAVPSTSPATAGSAQDDNR
jgi:hypothetical protein